MHICFYFDLCMFIAMSQLTALLIFAYFVLHISANRMLGPGIWSLKSVGKCSIEMDEEVAVMNVNKHKLNRTHDGFSVDVKCLDDIGDNYGGLIKICKFVDGGCKPYLQIAGESVRNMFKEYAKEENIVNWLTLANIDPPDFPVPKGEYHIDDFIMNFCDLPRDNFYGEFESTGYLMNGPKKVGCIKAVTEFNKFDEENYCDK